MFISGKREYAITRVNDLIAVADDSAKYDYLQARIMRSVNASRIPLKSFKGSRKYVLDERRFGTYDEIIRAGAVLAVRSARLSFGDDPPGKSFASTTVCRAR